ncbi:hypothetical protein Aduo_006404 [Ancylostoma duodenale]
MKKHRKAKLKLKRRNSLGDPAKPTGCVPTENDANNGSVDTAPANKQCLVLHTNFDADEQVPIDGASAPIEAIENAPPNALTDSANIVKNGSNKRRKRKRRRQSSTGEVVKRHKGKI